MEKWFEVSIVVFWDCSCEDERSAVCLRADKQHLITELHSSTEARFLSFTALYILLLQKGIMLGWGECVGEIAFVLHPTVYPELYELIIERGGDEKWSLKLLQKEIASYIIRNVQEKKYWTPYVFYKTCFPVIHEMPPWFRIKRLLEMNERYCWIEYSTNPPWILIF